MSSARTTPPAPARSRTSSLHPWLRAGWRSCAGSTSAAATACRWRSCPFGRDTAHSYVSFLAAEPDPDGVARLAELAGQDGLSVAGRDVFLRYLNGVQGARLTGPLLERHLGRPGTVRNWRTVTKLAELAAEG